MISKNFIIKNLQSVSLYRICLFAAFRDFKSDKDGFLITKFCMKGY